jgi:hypothetical protein
MIEGLDQYVNLIFHVLSLFLTSSPLHLLPFELHLQGKDNGGWGIIIVIRF